MGNNYLLYNRKFKSVLVLVTLMLLPTVSWGKTYSKTYTFVPYTGDDGYFECYNGERWEKRSEGESTDNGIMVQGGTSLRLTSEEVFPAQLSKVVVTVGVGSYGPGQMYGDSYSTESVYLYVENNEKDVYVTPINKYQGSYSNIDFRDYTFNSISRNAESSIDIELSASSNCDLYLREIYVEWKEITEYGLMVGGVNVTDENASNITDSRNQSGQPFVSYNAITKTLTLNELNVNAPEDNYINSEIDDLKVRLVGDNRIVIPTSKMYVYSAFSTTKASNKLTFITTDSHPGTLTIEGLEDTPFDIYEENNIKFRNNLLYQLNDGVATIEPFLQPVIKEVGETTIDGDGDGLGKDIMGITDGNLPANGIVVNNILYTLGEDDGFDPEDTKDGLLVDLNTKVTEVSKAQPGTVDFAKDFHGLTFLLPAGTGTVFIEARTNVSGVLNVKIGNQKAKVYQNLENLTEVEIPYACTQSTFVYVYNSDAASASSPSQRAPGRRNTGTLQLKKIRVRSHTASSTSPADGVQKILTKDDITIVDGHITVTDTDITDLAEDVFEGINSLTYVDLSATSIYGLVVDRTKLPFSNLPPTAFVYLPYDNDVEEGSDNVVIGDVCYDMLLGNGNFDVASDFIAVNASLDRTLPDKSTIMLPFALDEETAGNIGTFYAFKAIEDNQVNMESVTATEANQPYMLLAKTNTIAAEMVEVLSATADTEEASARSVYRAAATPEFVGVYQSTTVKSDAYTYDADSGTFKLVTSATKVTPFQAYIKAEGATVTPLDVLFDGHTGIQTVQMKVNASDIYYDLQGRRLIGKPVQKGIYIYQGRKFLVK
ncbi:MAG: hypothetical protein J6I37_06450 [Prevotella sp.]|nr:hypothetical protein [Prevotella sp.]